MHIVDGALANEVVLAGAVIAVAGVGIGLRKLDTERIPVAGVLSATFFVASLVHVPIGPTSIHLVMNGLAGLVLGWAAFPALFVGLVLQALFFGFGGITVLGVNTLVIALPAVVAGMACRRGINHENVVVSMAFGLIAGGGAIALTALGVAAALALSGEPFFAAAQLVLVAHVPIMGIEALLCASAVYLVRRVKPELFGVLTSPLGRAAHV